MTLEEKVIALHVARKALLETKKKKQDYVNNFNDKHYGDGKPEVDYYIDCRQGYGSDSDDAPFAPCFDRSFVFHEGLCRFHEGFEPLQNEYVLLSKKYGAALSRVLAAGKKLREGK